MSDIKLRFKIVITNKQALRNLAASVRRLARLYEYQDWNSELREIYDGIVEALKHVEMRRDGSQDDDVGNRGS
jgi:hypothetical protein